MSYKDYLTQISQAILKFDTDSSGLNNIINEDTLQRFRIYKSNYFNHCQSILAGDLPALHKYLGENNFNFFVRKFLLEEGVNSAAIFELSEQFKVFIINSHDIHKDDLIEDIAKIDLLCSHSLQKKISVVSGALEFWQELMYGLKSDKEINLSKLVNLEIIEISGEQAFKLVN